MPFEEFVLGLVLVSGAISLIGLKMIFNYQKWKQGYVRPSKRSKSAAEDSVGLAELERLIRNATEAANAPLLARLEAIEEHLEPTPPVLHDPLAEEDAYETPAQKTLGRPARQR